ncbi:unnamed protein product, partial [Prorocentrum cordatum]
SGARPPKTAAAVCRAAKPRASRSAPGCRCHAVSVRGREEGCWWEHHRQIRPDGARTGCQGAEGAGQLAQRRESLRGDEAGGADAQIEQQQAQRTQAQLQRSQLDAEEKRKTISHQNEQERRTAEYKARLDSELYQSKLED